MESKKPSLLSRSILLHPVMLGTYGIITAILIGSGVYYTNATRVPSAVVTPYTQTGSHAITASGTVAPAQNPDLSFDTSGRIVRINVKVGDRVYSGQSLAALDTSLLSASREAAVASVRSAEARLAQLKAPARTVDVTAKQTAVDQANQALANAYANAPAALRDAYDKAYGAVHTNTDSLFSSPNSSNPSVVFSTADSQSSARMLTARSLALGELDAWKSELAALSSASSPAEIEAVVLKADKHLAVVRAYTSSVSEALAQVITTTNFTQTTLAAAQTNAQVAGATIGGLVTSVETGAQLLTNDKLAVRAAQDSLAQVQAGATDADIQAQAAQVDAARAQVSAVDAQIAKEIIVAPFAGTVASVHAKVGDSALANTPVISLSPTSALQITAYFSERDIGSIAPGVAATVTLDAYGSSRPFSASVVDIDHAPTMQNGVPAYKATLQFANSDPAIAVGMTANVTIIPAPNATN